LVFEVARATDYIIKSMSRYLKSWNENAVITAKMRIAIISKATTNPNAKQVCQEINNEIAPVSYSTVLKVIKAAGIDLTEAARERMKRLHADPEFAARQAAAARKSLKRLHTNPEFAARHATAVRERLKLLHADPEFAAANRERMKRMRSDPDLAARQAAAASERMKRLHADPEFEARRIAGIRNRNAPRRRKRGR
jgi:hypothetical protein